MTLKELDELLINIVTGDGQQLENLTMTDEEWAESFNGEDDTDITVSRANWLALVRYVRLAQQIRCTEAGG